MMARIRGLVVCKHGFCMSSIKTKFGAINLFPQEEKRDVVVKSLDNYGAIVFVLSLRVH